MPQDTNLYIRRANPINDAFSSLFAGAGQIVDAIQTKNKHNDLIEEFNQTKDYLQQMYKINTQATNDVINLVKTPTSNPQQTATDTKIISSPVGVDNNVSSIAPEKISPQDIYSKVLDKALRMSANYGQESQPYVSALTGLYNNYFGKETPKPDYREVDGSLYLIDPKDPSNPKKVVGKTPKEEKKKYTPTEVYSMTLEDILAMPEGNDFIDKNFNALSPETQKALQEKYPYLIPEEKTTGTGRRSGYRGAYNPPKSYSVQDSIKRANDLFELKDSYDTMTPDEKGLYDDSLGKLATEMGITGADEINKFIEDIRNSDEKTATKIMNEYKSKITTFDENIQAFDMSDLANDLYSVETDPSKNPNGVKEIWDMLDKAEAWVNLTAKGLSNAQANLLFQTFQDLKDKVLRSKYLK